jgi:nucleoside-diphosphate-sugar epimerase
MSRIILLGATGFIGSNLLNELKKQNFQVKAMTHKKSLKISSPNFSGNIMIPKKLDLILKKDDIVINLIGQISKNQKKFIQTNILGSINLLESCYKKKVKKVIFLSSINVYGENLKSPSLETDTLKPITLYGQIKLLTEEIYKSYADLYEIDVTVLRLSNIYGPNKKSGFIANLINSLYDKKIKNVAYNNGNQYRDLLFIDDAISAIISAIKNSKNGLNIYNISSGKRYSIKKIILTIEQLSKKKVNVRFSNNVPDEKCIWANYSKAYRYLNFSPIVSLDEGLCLILKN